MKNIKLYYTMDEFLEKEAHADEIYVINSYPSKVIRNGDFYNWSVYKNLNTTANITYNGSAFTAETCFYSEGQNYSREYYAVKYNELHPEGGYAEDYYALLYDESGTIQYSSEATKAILNPGEKKICSNGNLFDAFEGEMMVCSSDSTQDERFYEKTFTTDWAVIGTITITGSSWSSSYDAYNFTCIETGEVVHGYVNNTMWDPEAQDFIPTGISFYTGNTFVFGGYNEDGYINRYLSRRVAADTVKNPEPSFAFVSGSNETMFNNTTPKYKVRVTYDIEVANEPVMICGQGIQGCCKLAILDNTTVIWNDTPIGVLRPGDESPDYWVIDYGMDSAYTFETTGTHVIDYYTDSERLLGGLFSNGYYGEKTSGITRMEIGEGITHVDANNYYSYLEYLSIPSTAEYIAVGANENTVIDYQGTPSQWADKFPMGGLPFSRYGGEYSGALLFNGVELQDFVICGITEICYTCFNTVPNMTSLTICEGVKGVKTPGHIYNSSNYKEFFSNCPNLKRVVYPSSWEDSCEFDGCRALEEVVFPSTLRTIGTRITGSFSSAGTLVLPQNITGITGRDSWDNPFSGCGFSNIIFNNGLKTIGRGAFMGCYGLTAVTLPESLVTMEDYAFSGCTGITQVTFSPNMFQIANYGAPGYCFSKANVNSVVFPEGIKTLPAYLFWSSLSIYHVTIPYTVKIISPLSLTPSNGTGGFVCSSLTLDCQEWIDMQAWSASSSSSLTQYLGFWHNSNSTCINRMTKITFGPHITNLPVRFLSGAGINEVHFMSPTPPTIATNSISKVASTGTIYVPTGASTAYSSVRTKFGSNWTIQEE